MPPTSEMKQRGNPDRLRADIDQGRTGDKVRVNDPAAAPLGTDDEAAGTPPSRERVQLAREQELGRGPQHAETTFPKAWLLLVAFGAVLLLSVGLIRF